MKTTIYETGAAMVEENRALLEANPYLSAFFFLDAPLLTAADKVNYAVRLDDDGKTLLALKVEPFNLMLYGAPELAQPLAHWLMAQGYEVKSLLGAEDVCDRFVAAMETAYGVPYWEALAMDFMEAREITEPSDPEVTAPTEDDLAEIVDCLEHFIVDCNLQDRVNVDSTRRTLDAFRLLRLDGRIASMAKICPSGADDLRVSDVYTRPEYRGRGLARRVVNTAKNDILARGKVATLNVDKRNPVTNHLYRALGFVPLFSQGEYRRT